MGRLRGLRDLVHDAIDSITNLVQETHEASARTPVDLVAQVPGLELPTRAVDRVRKLTADTVFSTIRGVNRGVQEVGNAIESLAAGGGLERAGEQIEELASPGLRAAAGAASSAGQGA